MKKTNYGSDVEVIWSDRKRYFGLPISFTKYSILRKPGKWIKLVREMGLFSTEVEDIQMYRIDDINVYESLIHKIFGVGNIEVFCNDSSCNKLVITRVKSPKKVRNILNDLIEEDRQERRVHQSEVQY